MSSDITLPDALHLPDGLAGLPEVHDLQAVAIAGGQFIELLDPRDPALGWLAASADDVRDGMTDELRAAGKVAEDEVLVVLLASHGDPAVVTANLAGPIAISPDGTARQLILEDPAFDVRARVGRLVPSPVEHAEHAEPAAERP